MAHRKDVTNLLYNYYGKMLSTYLTHTNPSSTVTPQTTLLTKMGYDAAGPPDFTRQAAE
ncbi:hypothetical protein [Chitinophaga sp. LS1]|uniref:hypothetical protein n=1 Tax=Chitinophaga sp. LS1 TaxID=3051176 RepID=UPI002AAAAC6A|nr:hypothetical protein [Chitinophaga sp. LS1]WPV69684.1 hypothetical protein QQL36_13350 [Chitinophaga sp. LS1]